MLHTERFDLTSMSCSSLSYTDSGTSGTANQASPAGLKIYTGSVLTCCTCHDVWENPAVALAPLWSPTAERLQLSIEPRPPGFDCVDEKDWAHDSLEAYGVVNGEHPRQLETALHAQQPVTRQSLSPSGIGRSSTAASQVTWHAPSGRHAPQGRLAAPMHGGPWEGGRWRRCSRCPRRSPRPSSDSRGARATGSD